jgi:drug/metabolite transporter (DMT)-like permease
MTGRCARCNFGLQFEFPPMADAAHTLPHPTAAKCSSPVLALTLAALFWSGNFIAGRAMRGQIDPLTLNFLRWALALVLMSPFVWRDIVASRRVLRRKWQLILALGATGIAAFHTLVYFALQRTSVTNALLILALAPAVTLAGSAALRTEALSWLQLFGTLLSLLGAAVLITHGQFPTSMEAFNRGDLLMLAAMALWATYSLLLRRRPADLSQAVALSASIAVALMLLAPAVVLFAPTAFTTLPSRSALLCITYVALFASALGFLLWSHGLSQIGPARASQFVQLMPLFGAALSYFILGETLTLAQFGGAILVMSGIVIVEHRFRRAPPSTDDGVTA